MEQFTNVETPPRKLGFRVHTICDSNDALIGSGYRGRMRTLAAEEMIGFISFLAVILVFFSIDIRSRDTDRDLWHELLFEYTSRIGGIAAAVALATGWVSAFTQSPTGVTHLVLLAIPGSVSVLCAIVLGIEILFVADVPEARASQTAYPTAPPKQAD